MKLNKYIGLAVCSCVMAACQNDGLGLNQPSGSEQYTLIGQIENNDVDGRAQIELGSNAMVEYFYWNEGDRFTLYQDVNNELVSGEFVISEDYNEEEGRAQNAEFTTDIALTPSADYLAVYPCPAGVNDNKVRMEIQRSVDFSSATTDEQKAEVWKRFFNNNMFMVASGTLSESGRNYIAFNHLCALIRISYSNQTGTEQQISRIRLEGQNLGHFVNYDLESGSIVESGSLPNYIFTTTGLTVADKETVDIYMFFFPKAVEDTDLQIVIEQANGSKTISLASTDIVSASYGNRSFRPGLRYWFELTDTKDNGLDWTKNTVTESLVEIKNQELSTALLDLLGSYKVKINSNGYAVMSQQHAEQVYELDFGQYQYSITSLSGIENFKYLQSLTCRGTGLKECDLNQNNRLYYVDLMFNELEELYFNDHPYLQRVWCSHNPDLSVLNVKSCEALREISCDETALTSLHIAKPEIVTYLTYAYTGISLDLTQFPNLDCLNVSGHNLSSLELAPQAKTKIGQLMCNNNNLTSIDLSEYPNLWAFYCSGNKITDLDLSVAPNIQMLSCDGNLLTTLNIKPLSNLISLYCGKQQNDIPLELQLTDAQKELWTNEWSAYVDNENVYLEGETPVVNTVTIKNAELSNALLSILGAENVTLNDQGYAVMKKSFVESVKVLSFGWSSYQVTESTGLEHFVNLEELNFNNARMTVCDLSKNTALKNVNLGFNNFTELDLSSNVNLEYLYLSGCRNMTTLKIAHCSSLNKLYVNECTGLSTLDVPNKSNFIALAYSNTNLRFDLTEFPNLVELNCTYNGLTELDITPLGKLQYLFCGQNELLTLRMTEAQKILWDTTWSSENVNVEPVVVSGE